MTAKRLERKKVYRIKAQAGGTKVRRLWIRSYDKRWIEIPYGSRQDTNIKSVNIWDGTQWLVPTWYPYLKALAVSRDDTFEPVVLNVRTPDVVWLGSTTRRETGNHVWNPNWEMGVEQAFTVEEQDFA